MDKVKISLLVAFLIACSCAGIAQTKWTIGVNCSPTLTKMNGYSAPSNFHPAYSAGLKSMFFLNDNMFLDFGLMHKQKSDELSFPYTHNLIDDHGNIIYDNVEFYTTKFTGQYFSIPLGFNYLLPQKEERKISMLVSAGIGLNYLYKVQSISNLPDGNQEIRTYKEDEIEKSIGSDLTIGAGLFCELSPSFILLAKAQYGYGFHFSNENEPKFHSFELNIELHYALKSK